VFEAEDEPGGMMTQAIPEFRLPKERVLNEIERLKKHNVVIRTSFPIEGGDVPSHLIDQGYGAVFLAIGNAAAKKIDIPGAYGPGVHWGLQLLRDVKAGNRPPMGERVIVIGGGNVAVDAAMTALRLGGSEVDMICLEKLEEMPAHTSELQGAMAEGVKIHNSWGPAEVIREDAKVRRVDFIRCTRVFDDSGRFNPKYDSDETYSVECDSVILAIGQEIGDSFRDSALLGEGRLIASDPETCATAAEGVFAGGEATRGPLSIIDAVQEGRRAAAAIDKYLGGDGLFEDESRFPAGPAIGRDEGFSRRGRVPPPSRSAASPEGAAKATPASSDAMLGNFAEIEGAITEEQARYEASRCLQCDLRLQISAVVPPPKPGRLLPLTQSEVESVPETEGVYRLYDESGETMKISGSANLKAALQEELAKGQKSFCFDFEEEPMYTKRESELIQQYLQRHGRMPGAGGDDDLDDLF
jgi:NADH-quinone oxidoreductase subunit F